MPAALQYMFRVLKELLFEVALIILLLFIFNNYLKYSATTLAADGIGYYDYLPSCFLRGDFVRNDIPLSTHPEAYRNLPPDAGYVQIGDRMVDKYPVGTALLELPFFCWAKNQMPPAASGYEPVFQFAVFCAAIAYLFFGLLFTKFFLRSFGAGTAAIAASQFILVFCTPVLIYVNHDAGFSHVYSFFAIAAFLYFARSYFLYRRSRAFIGACVFLALIFLLRQVNLVILLALPLIAGGWPVFRQGISELFRRYRMLICGILTIVALVLVQLIGWYLQTGKWIVYSYQGETFNFAEPHVFSILFSYQKGLFVYTPALFVSFLCSFHWIRRRDWWTFFQFHAFFFVLAYLLSSWWTWVYGASYGQRVYIDFLPLMILPFALFFQAARTWLRILLQSVVFVLAYANCIQAYQYSNFILHWGDMDKEKYWKVFLKTDLKYSGWVWQQPVSLDGFSKVSDYPLGDVAVTHKDEHHLRTLDLAPMAKAGHTTIVRFSFRSNFHDASDLYLLFKVQDTVENQNYYWHKVPLIQFAKQTDIGPQRGMSDLVLPVLTLPEQKKFIICSVSESGEREVLHASRLEAFVSEKPAEDTP